MHVDDKQYYFIQLAVALFARTVVVNSCLKTAVPDTGVGFFSKRLVFMTAEILISSLFSRLKCVCSESEQNPLCLLMQSNLESMTS